MAIANISGNILTDSGVSTSSLVSGTGTTNYLPKFTGASTLGDSVIQEVSGNIGIGGSPSGSYKFEVTGTGIFTGALTGAGATFSGLLISSTTDAYPEFRTTALDADVFLGFANTGDNNNAWSIGRRNTGEFWISNYTGNFNSGTRTTPLVITPSGNVGIGTTTPAELVEVSAPAVAGTSQQARLRITQAGSISARANLVSGVISGENPYFAIETRQSASPFSIVERLRIDGNGNVGIGTSSPNRTLVVSAAVSGAVTEIYNTRNNSSGDFVFVTSLGSNAANTSSYHYIASTGGSDRFYVYGNGNVVNTNNSYGPLSDIKLKENIVDATPKLDKLMQVRIVNYNLIGDDLKQIGVIAQELEQVFPGLVDEHPDRDAEGNQLDTTTKSVKMSVFVPMLIKAIQELSAKVSALENKA
jgi:hypothetical protein